MQLWLPIVLSAVILFIASSVIWMFAPHHKTEWKEPPQVDALRTFLRQSGITAGAFVFPHMTAADRADKAKAAEKMKQAEEGPAGVLFLRAPGPMGMGRMMVQQFVFFLVVAALIALLDVHMMDRGTVYLAVFKRDAIIAFLTFGLGTAPESIWFARPWKSFWLQAIDAAIYAGLLAGTFGWLWPR